MNRMQTFLFSNPITHQWSGLSQFQVVEGGRDSFAVYNMNGGFTGINIQRPPRFQLFGSAPFFLVVQGQVLFTFKSKRMFPRIWKRKWVVYAGAKVDKSAQVMELRKKSFHWFHPEFDVRFYSKAGKLMPATWRVKSTELFTKRKFEIREAKNKKAVLGKVSCPLISFREAVTDLQAYKVSIHSPQLHPFIAMIISAMWDEQYLDRRGN